MAVASGVECLLGSSGDGTRSRRDVDARVGDDMLGFAGPVSFLVTLRTAVSLDPSFVTWTNLSREPEGMPLAALLLELVSFFLAGAFFAALADSAASHSSTAAGTLCLATASRTQARSGFAGSYIFPTMALDPFVSIPSTGASNSSSLFSANPPRPDAISSSTSLDRSMGTMSCGTYDKRSSRVLSVLKWDLLPVIR